MIKKQSNNKATIEIVTTIIIIVLLLLLDSVSGGRVGNGVGLEVVKKLQPHVTFIEILHDAFFF